MPHIRMRALEENQVAKLSSLLCKELATTANTSEDHFTFELVKTTFFFDGKAVKSFPFVEVLWFDRPQTVQDTCAKIITSHVKEVAGSEDVIVVFSKLTKDSYYENGEHF